jgi:NAD-dependent deacetylase
MSAGDEATVPASIEVTVERARSWIADASRVTVLTGAGISTDSGIPDFRGPNGLWTRNPLAEKASTLEHYLNDPHVREAAWQNRLTSPAWQAEPNAGHRALVSLEQADRLEALVTQNIDELHQKAGHDPDKVIEVHGTMWWSRCWTCSDRRPMHEAIERVRAGDPDPHCLVCVEGILKSDTISFGQALVPEVIDAALRAAERCEVLLAAGSSLSVFPAANIVPRAKAAGARVVIVNGQPTKMDRFADELLLGELSHLLPALVGSSE